MQSYSWLVKESARARLAMDFSATDNLSRLVVRKHGLLMQMRDVGRQQLALIAGGDMTLLLKLLASKQRLLGDYTHSSES